MSSSPQKDHRLDGPTSSPKLKREISSESSFPCAMDNVPFVRTAFRMELSKEEIRLLLHFHYKLGVNASGAHRPIGKVYGEEICGVCTAQTAQRRFKIFCEKGDRLTEKPRERCSREVDR
ncbi:hypothetical protein KIN20_037964 [Parelaphostrongylus tenuis]|uniref:Uncharacterized protein n=1 Tax=Parelaphostrongylus tenuis TaxID=148309 RepID=A0AAD5RES3_PARTN|nr:hypothetical protein KIN20_037964 [Parelaphostrongylus tenuis]